MQSEPSRKWWLTLTFFEIVSTRIAMKILEMVSISEALLCITNLPLIPFAFPLFIITAIRFNFKAHTQG